MTTIPDSNSRTARTLIAWFGISQTVHILVNLRAFIRFSHDQTTFPAHPPADGWSDETQGTLEGMAGIDIFAAVLTLAFITDYYRNGDQWPWLGTVALTIANYSATIYAFPT